MCICRKKKKSRRVTKIKSVLHILDTSRIINTDPHRDHYGHPKRQQSVDHSDGETTEAEIILRCTQMNELWYKAGNINQRFHLWTDVVIDHNHYEEYEE